MHFKYKGRQNIFLEEKNAEEPSPFLLMLSPLVRINICEFLQDKLRNLLSSSRRKEVGGMEAVQGNAERYKQQALPHASAMMSAEELTGIYDLYYKRVFKYICYRINNHYAAEDLCSQVFETVMRKYHSYSPDKSGFDVWLFAIVRNAVTDYFRSRKTKRHFSLDAIMEMVFPKPSPEELAIRDDNNRALFHALAQLREKERNIIAMKYGAGLKNSDIAQVMGVSDSNIGVVLHRSLKKLQQTLEAGGFRNE